MRTIYWLLLVFGGVTLVSCKDPAPKFLSVEELAVVHLPNSEALNMRASEGLSDGGRASWTRSDQYGEYLSMRFKSEDKMIWIATFASPKYYAYDNPPIKKAYETLGADFDTRQFWILYEIKLEDSDRVIYSDPEALRDDAWNYWLKNPSLRYEKTLELSFDEKYDLIDQKSNR